MKKNTITSTVPGSMMLLGEHAVLHGHLSIVSAVNKFITVSLTPRDDDAIYIEAADLGKWSGYIDDIVVEKPFQFVLAVLQRYQRYLLGGFELKIQSDFSSQLGLGSSAAVTVATVMVVREFIAMMASPTIIFSEARDVVRQVQGVASGADVAASIYGGVVAYAAEPLYIEKIYHKDQPVLPPLALIYSGCKVPTIEVIAQVNAWREKNQALADKIFEAIDRCSHEGVRALAVKRWDLLGEIFKVQQGLMCELQLNNEVLDELIEGLNNMPDVFGAKISGSGLGDCVVAVGEVVAASFPANNSQREKGVMTIEINVTDQEAKVYLNEL